MPNSAKPMNTAKMAILFAMTLISNCRGDDEVSSSWVMSAILPSSVSIPLATTIPFALPEATVVPRYAMLSLSASPACFFMVSEFFSWGMDSPVREKSFVLKLKASIMRMSAGILSPSSMYIMSPGTRSDCGISLSSPSLYAFEGDWTSFFRESIMFSALFS